MGELNHMACPCASSPPLSLSRQSSVSPKSRKQRALSRGTHIVGQLIQKAVCSFSLGCVRKNAQHPHFDVPENLQYTSDNESNVFLSKSKCWTGGLCLWDTIDTKLPTAWQCPSCLFYWHRNCKSTSCHQSWNTIFWCHEQVCSEIQRNILCWFHSKMGCMERMQASKMEYHFRISSLGTNGAPTAMFTQTTPFQSFFESPQPWG